MSDLRIRSEAVSDDVWAQPFLPPSARGGEAGDDDSDFGPLLSATARGLTALFGLAVTVRAGRPVARGDGGVPPRVSAGLAGVLATVRMGGDPARAGGVTGVSLARHAAAIVAALDAASASDWPAGCRLAGFDLDIACAAVEGHALLLAPPRVLPPPPLPIARLAREVLGLPMRIRVELAAEVRMIGSLLPLRAGQVLAISPTAEMPLIVGRHSIGLATVTALPDGRQLAEIVAIGVDDLGGRA